MKTNYFFIIKTEEDGFLAYITVSAKTEGVSLNQLILSKIAA